jgi:hypothetical protein
LTLNTTYQFYKENHYSHAGIQPHYSGLWVTGHRYFPA